MLRSLLILAACSSLASAQEFESVRVTNGLYFPIGAEAAPGTVNRLYVHEQRGIIKIVDTLNGSVSGTCLLYTSPSPRDRLLSRMPSSA